MRRTFLDADLMEWEAYVSGGQPDTEAAARIYFVCLTDPFERPRWVREESGDPARAQARLEAMEEEELAALLADASPLD